MMEIRIFSPENIIDNHQLEHGAWTAKKIFDKTGIQTRHISSSSDSALSLAVHAADRLFCDTKINRSVIQSLIYCTQNPDYISCRTIFGDGATATFLTKQDACGIGKFVFGTQGSGFQALYLTGLGARTQHEPLELHM